MQTLTLLRAVSLLAVVVALISTAPADASARPTVVAKFGPSFTLRMGINSVASTTTTSYGVRRTDERRIRVMRMPHKGRPRTLFRTSLAPDTVPRMSWATASHGAIGFLTDEEDVEFFMPEAKNQRLYVVTDRGGVKRLTGGQPAAIAARGKLVAALEMSLPKLIYNVYDVSGRSPKLLHRASVPWSMDIAHLPNNMPSVGVFQIDILGDHFALYESSRVTVFNWRTREVVEQFPTDPGAPDAVAMTGDTIVAKSYVTNGKALQSQSLAGFARPSGIRRWTEDSPRSYNSAVDGALRFFNWPTESPSEISQLDPYSGADFPVGKMPHFLESEMSNLMVYSPSTNANTVTWVEDDCYWTKVVVKPIDEPVERRRSNCDFTYVKGSMRLESRRLTMRINSAHGMRAENVETEISGRGRSVNEVSAPPGSRMLTIKLNPRDADALRRNPRLRVTVKLTTWAQPTRTISDNARVR